MVLQINAVKYCDRLSFCLNFTMLGITTLFFLTLSVRRKLNFVTVNMSVKLCIDCVYSCGAKVTIISLPFIHFIDPTLVQKHFLTPDIMSLQKCLRLISF